MAFLHLNFDNFKFRDLGHFDFLSFKVLAPTHKMPVQRVNELEISNML